MEERKSKKNKKQSANQKKSEGGTNTYLNTKYQGLLAAMQRTTSVTLRCDTIPTTISKGREISRSPAVMITRDASRLLLLLLLEGEEEEGEIEGPFKLIRSRACCHNSVDFTKFPF